ncbi:hypothetical protein ACA910_019295 [Epithemia clementina (nom. ined.)]
MSSSEQEFLLSASSDYQSTATTTKDEENDEEDNGAPKVVRPSSNRRLHNATTTTIEYVDHFSLQAPSDAIRFRGTAVRVFANGTQQFQMVQQQQKQQQQQEQQQPPQQPHSNDKATPRTTLKAKITSDGSAGLSMIRGLYTLVAILMLGFLLIFAIQVLLFLFVSLVMQGGLSSKQSLNWFHLLGTILSAPIFVHGLSSVLTMATEFVIDTWQGHDFFRSVLLRISSVVIDWTSFWFFLGIPLVVLLYQLLWTGAEHWWVPTALTWFGCILVSFGTFCIVVTYFEIWGALEMLSHHPDFQEQFTIRHDLGRLLKRAIYLRQLYTYSGVRHKTFYIEGAQTLFSPNRSYGEPRDGGGSSSSRSSGRGLADDEFVQESMSWYTHLTLRGASNQRLFQRYDIPKRQFHVEDALDRTVYVTDSTWNLEKLFCQRSSARSVLVVNGSSRVTPGQLGSSLACAVLGQVVRILLVTGFVKWAANLNGLVTVVVIVLCTFVQRAAFYKIYVLWDAYRDTRRRQLQRAAQRQQRQQGQGQREEQEEEREEQQEREEREEDQGVSEVIFQITETHRLTRPTDNAVWILFGLEVVFLFVFPLWMLFDVGNKPIAILFAIFGLFSSLRHYFNVPVVLSELGSLDLLDGEFIRTRRPTSTSSTAAVAEEDEASRQQDMALQDWREKNRLSKIVAHISQGARRDAWVAVIGTLLLMFLFLFLSAFSSGSNNGSASTPDNLLPDFRYLPQEGTFQYPTCAMTTEFAIPGGSNGTALADYAYLASIAYVAPESMPDMLNAWFGPNKATDRVDFVTKYRASDPAQQKSAVHYKLIQFADNPDFAVVTIRGTSNGWDMISDAQLWSAAYLAQMVRALLPMGEVWNPILEELVAMIGILQTSSLREVAFYVQTSEFVKYLKSQKAFATLRVTGHSLGGGLAMITGAQTHTPAIGLSGPNAIISRQTLFPPVTVEELNKYTFNIIPDRDPVPQIDDPAKNVQHISCLAAANNFVDCHTSLRSLCDIQYTCGSLHRPTLCECAMLYGYPEPDPTGNRTFAEACGHLKKK